MGHEKKCFVFVLNKASASLPETCAVSVHRRPKRVHPSATRPRLRTRHVRGRHVGACRPRARVGSYVQSLQSPTSPMYFSAMDFSSLTFATPRISKPNATLLSTVAQGSSAKSWKTNALSGPGPVYAFPVDLDVTRCGLRRSPAMIFKSVVLPQPDGPKSDVSWPRGNSSDISRSASTIAIVFRDVANRNSAVGTLPPQSDLELL